jgi:hypothetical protein
LVEGCKYFDNSYNEGIIKVTPPKRVFKLQWSARMFDQDQAESLKSQLAINCTALMMPKPNASEVLIHQMLTMWPGRNGPVWLRLLRDRGMAFNMTPGNSHTGSMKMGQCYMNAYKCSLEEGSYVEGYACPPGLFPMEHAWVQSIPGRGYDPTWKKGADYFGLVFKDSFIVEMFFKTGYVGISGSLYRLGMSPDEVYDYLLEGLV